MLLMIGGKIYLFRTVTMIYAGTLVYEAEDHYVVKDAVWIADTGRWADSKTSQSSFWVKSNK